MNTGNRRKGPRNAGGRGGRQRQNEKTIYNDGIYANPRFINATMSIIGCVVQVQVRNGNVYEGIFKTLSPKLEVVLEMAHMMDDLMHSNVPTRDRLIEKLILHCKDVVSIRAHNVDLDYASKEHFTDTAISKGGVNANGGIGVMGSEKELQPWDGGNEATAISLEDDPVQAVPVSRHTIGNDNTNGWDVREMFKVNEQQFKVQSTYDPSLSQYTTTLNRQDTAEYRDREARAAEMAKEIERSDSYMQHIALENGDGEDEEARFSAVVRPTDNNNSGKYVPPHLRTKPTGNVRPAQQRQGPPTTTQASVPTSNKPVSQDSRSEVPVHVSVNNSMNVNSQVPMSANNQVPMSGNNQVSMSGNNQVSMSGNNQVSMSGNNQVPMSGNNQVTMSANSQVSMSTNSPVAMNMNNQVAMGINNQVVPGGPPIQQAMPPQHTHHHRHNVNVPESINGGEEMNIEPVCDEAVDRMNEIACVSEHSSSGAPVSPLPPPTMPPNLENKDLSQSQQPQHTEHQHAQQSTLTQQQQRHDSPRKPLKNREEEIKELKDFGSTFKLSPEKDRKSQLSVQVQPCQTAPGAPPPMQPQTHTVVPAPSATPPTPTSPHPPPAQSPPEKNRDLEKQSDERVDEPEAKIDDTVKKSTLNPNAKAFVMNPNAKPFTPAPPAAAAPPVQVSQPHPMPAATPPRPHTQSPVILPHGSVPGPMPPMQPTQPMHYQPHYHAMPGPAMMPATIPQPQPQQFPKGPRKTAVVSVQPRPEYNPAAQAAAATGQPIIAPQQPQYTLQYMPPHPAQHNPHMAQMVQVPTAAGTRMMAPHTQHTHTVQPDQVQPNPQPQVFVPGATAHPAAAHMASHMVSSNNQPGHAPHGPPVPAHMAPHHQPTPPHSQPSHNNQSSATGHPAPSPVQQHQPGQAPGQHPALPGQPHQHQHSAPHQHPAQNQAGAPPGSHPGHPPASTTPQQPQLYMYPHNQQMAGPGGPTPGQHPPLQPSPHTPTSPQTMYPTLSYPTGYTYTTQAGIMGQPQMTLAGSPHTGAGAPGGGHPGMATHPHQTVMMMPPNATQHAQMQAAAANQQQHMHLHQQHQHHMQGVAAQAPHMMQQGGQQTAMSVSTSNQMPTSAPHHHGAPQPMPHYPMQPPHKFVQII